LLGDRSANEAEKPLQVPSFDERAVVLAIEQRLKMAQSVHAYVRGSTLKFYEWLEKSSSGKVPNGPDAIQILILTKLSLAVRHLI
jgi:Uncharacterized protein conserved in bacteria (DUF2252)